MKIDVAAHLGAVVRRVEDRVHEGKAARVVLATRDYPTDIEDCWDAVTNPERIARWFSPVTGELKEGGRYQVQGNAGGTITRCVAPTAFSLTWEMHGGVSWVNVTLAKKSANVTTLTLEHIAHPEEHWSKFGPGAVGIGWELGLMGLAQYVAGDHEGSPEDVRAQGLTWMTSDEGKAFMRGSGAAWGDADAAGGSDPVGAKQRAAATIAAYTGEAAP